MYVTGWGVKNDEDKNQLVPELGWRLSRESQWNLETFKNLFSESKISPESFRDSPSFHR